MEGMARAKAQRCEHVGDQGEVCDSEMGLARDMGKGGLSLAAKDLKCQTKECGCCPGVWETQEFVGGGETSQAGLEDGSRRG